MKPGLVSSAVDNSKWKIHGDLLLPSNFEEKPREEVVDAPQEPELDEEEGDDEPPAPIPTSVEVEEPTPATSPRTVATPSTPPVAQTVPVPARTLSSAKPGDEIPKNWWITVAVILGIGLLIVVWFKRPQVKGGSQLPNTQSPQQAIAPEAPKPPMMAFDTTAYEQARDAKFQEALKEARKAWGSCGQVCQARRDYYLAKADALLKQTGTPIEVTLIRELKRQLGEQLRVLPYHSELGGYTTKEFDQIGVGRSLSGDALALLEALDQEWTRQRQLEAGQPLPARTNTTIDLAPLSNQMAELWQLAAMARNSKPQQEMRNLAGDEPSSIPDESIDEPATSKPKSEKPKSDKSEKSDKPEKTEDSAEQPEKVVGVPK